MPSSWPIKRSISTPTYSVESTSCCSSCQLCLSSACRACGHVAGHCEASFAAAAGLNSCRAVGLWRQATLSETASTPGIPDALASPGGILSTDQTLNPTFSTWNHVYVWYCTSDSSLGENLLACRCRRGRERRPMPLQCTRCLALHDSCPHQEQALLLRLNPDPKPC